MRRAPSRLMPPISIQNSPLTIGDKVILGIIGITLVMIIAIFPLLLLIPVAIALGCCLFEYSERRRLAILAADRKGESICSFARSFVYRRFDTWIIRAVHEAFVPYCRFGSELLPLRSTDTFTTDLNIDSEDLEDLVCEVAVRVGRSLENYEANPFYGRLNSVFELVMFLANQPRLEAERLPS